LKYKTRLPLILALPRGGVPVGYEVARALEAPLDTLVVRKVGAPQNPEFGVGAIAPGDVIILDNASIRSLGLEPRDLDPVIEEEMSEMERRMLRYRSGQYSEDIATDTILLVDDGIATGVTARAAIESVSMVQKPSQIIFAAPICGQGTADAISSLVPIECVYTVPNLIAIDYWYETFPQTEDEEVVEYLEQANKNYAQRQKTKSHT
jgi:putative phosphoribosyl transferase